MKNTKEYNKNYYKNHKGKLVKNAISYRKKYKQKWYLDNKERIGKSDKDYSQTISGKYSMYQNNARIRFLIWDLSEVEFESFWQKPCFYCGIEVKTIGLDRKDNLEGYNIKNVVSCCTKCNRMKSTMNSRDFISSCQIIARRFGV